MRKITVFLLLIALLCGAASAKGAQDQNKAAQAMVSMGVFEAADRLQQPVTRAEAVTMVVRMLGLEQAVENVKAQPSFEDVPVSHWAYGAVHVMERMGIIGGITKTAFAPSQAVTFEQFVKMLVAAVKYDIMAQEKGGYPTGYLTVAKELHIFEAGEENAPVTRAFAAYLMANAMNVKPMLFRDPFQTGESLLQQKGLTEARGKIESVKEAAVIFRPSSVKSQTAAQTYNQTVSSGDSALPDAIEVRTADKLSAAYAGKNVTLYLYSMSFQPQLRYLVTEDSNLAMTVDPAKSEKIQRVKINASSPSFPYEEVSAFSEGYAVVRQNGKFGAVDAEGTLAVKAEWDALGDCRSGLFLAEKSGEKCFIDSKGEVAFKPEYTSFQQFSEGLLVVEKAGKFGAVDAKGKLAVKINWEQMGDFTGGISIVMQKGKYGAVDTKGKTVVPAKYETLSPLGEGVLKAVSGSRTEYLKTDGKKAFEMKYDEIQPFVNGYAAVQKDGKWGCIKPDGTAWVEPKYDEPFHFGEGLALVSENGRQSVINAEKETVMPAGKYVLSVEGGMILCKAENAEFTSLYDKSGKIVTEDIWKTLLGVKDGRVCGVLFDGACGYLGTDGRFHYTNSFQIVDVTDKGFLIESEGKIGFFNP